MAFSLLWKSVRLDLSGVDLATLSACETGLGKTAGGEGVLGLQRAFQTAGARTTVTSLWKIPDDATRSLMIDFYENLWTKKMSKIEALRQAQLTLMREVVKTQAEPGNRIASGPAARRRPPPSALLLGRFRPERRLALNAHSYPQRLCE